MLPVSTNSDQLPDKWFCEMNELDSDNNTCDAPEKDARWYYRHLSEQLDILKDSPAKCIAREAIDSALSQEEKAKLVERDKILTHLLKVTAGDQKSSVISKYYFHDALLAETEDRYEGNDAADANAPTDEVAKKQPTQESLVESIDKAYAYADKTTATIDGIGRSLEAEFAMKLNKEMKATVKSRLKELLARDSVESTKAAANSKGENVPSTTRTNPPPACEHTTAATLARSSSAVDEALNAKSNSDKSQTVQSTASEQSGAKVVKTKTAVRSQRQGCFSTPERNPKVDGNTSGDPYKKLTSSPDCMSSRSLASPNGARYPSTRRETSSVRKASPSGRTTRASPSSKVAKSRGRVGRKRSGARVTAMDESARVSPRKKRSVGTVNPSFKNSSARPSPESKTDVIDLLSDSSDEDVIEILSDSDSL